MTTDITGVLRAVDGEVTARLERVYDTDIDDLWAALTVRERLGRWLAPVEGELALGRDYRIVFDDADPSQQTRGTVLECRPPRSLVVSWRIDGWPDSTVTVALDSTDGGTRLVLEHTGLPVKGGPGYGAGWHIHLDRLTASLAGGDSSGSDWDERWSELLPAYQAQLEV